MKAKNVSGMRKCVHAHARASAYRQPSPCRAVEEKVMNWGREKQDRKYLGKNRKIL